MWEWTILRFFSPSDAINKNRNHRAVLAGGINKLNLSPLSLRCLREIGLEISRWKLHKRV